MVLKFNLKSPLLASFLGFPAAETYKLFTAVLFCTTQLCTSSSQTIPNKTSVFALLKLRIFRKKSQKSKNVHGVSKSAQKSSEIF